MTAIPVDTLRQPLDPEAPCGADLSYDPAFLALEDAARGKPEQQFGDTLIAAQEPDWRVVFDSALALLARTRDLRLAVLLARAGARLHGLSSYAQALSLAADWLESQWDHVIPPLDADDHFDPTMRLNALAPLADPATGLADLRSAALGGGRLPLSVRQVELAAGKAVPHGDEAVPTQDGVLQALRSIEAQAPGLLALLRQVQADARRIDAVLSSRAPGQGPDLKALQALAHTLGQAAASAEGVAPAAVEAGVAPPTHQEGARPLTAPGELRHREDVVRTLDRVCEWIERHEPTNPAPLLIRRAQRLMSKTNFLDIIRDLAPDSLGQIENIAGHPGD